MSETVVSSLSVAEYLRLGSAVGQGMGLLPLLLGWMGPGDAQAVTVGVIIITIIIMIVVAAFFLFLFFCLLLYLLSC